MFELDIGLISGAEINFDKSFHHFNLKKKIHAKSYLKRIISI